MTTQSLKGWEILLSWLFRYPSRCFLLRDPSDLQTFTMEHLPLRHFSRTYSRFNTKEGILCRVTKDQKDVDLIANLLSNLPPDISDITLAEILAKGLAYRTLTQGQKLSFGSHDYVVDEAFDLWNKMAAFGLSSKTGTPLLLFRGTDATLLTESGRASLISDLDPHGPGRSLFSYAQNQIHLWLNKMAEAGCPARAIGHSLGGAFVIYTLLSEYDLLSKTLPSYAFNYPGIPEDLAEQWHALPTDKRPSFKGILTRGDLVSKFGKLVDSTYEVSLEEPLRPIAAHERLIFAQNVAYMHAIDVERENHSESRRYYSTIQKHTSAIIYQMGLKHLFPTEN